MARTLARTGRYRSLKALAAEVRCAESTLRRHGVRLPRQPRSGARQPMSPPFGVSPPDAVPDAAVSTPRPADDDTAAACDLPAAVGVLPSFEFRPPDQGGDAMPALADGVWHCTDTLRRLETQRGNIKLRGVALTGPSAEQWAEFARAEVSRADTEGLKPGGYWKGDIDAMRDVLAEMAAPQTAATQRHRLFKHLRGAQDFAAAQLQKHHDAGEPDTSMGMDWARGAWNGAAQGIDALTRMLPPVDWDEVCAHDWEHSERSAGKPYKRCRHCRTTTGLDFRELWSGGYKPRLV